MRIDGHLSGVTPKKKGDVRVIEVKVYIRFDPDILSSLGNLFDTPVSIDIVGQPTLFSEDDPGE